MTTPQLKALLSQERENLTISLKRYKRNVTTFQSLIEDVKSTKSVVSLCLDKEIKEYYAKGNNEKQIKMLSDFLYTSSLVIEGLENLKLKQTP